MLLTNSFLILKLDVIVTAGGIRSFLSVFMLKLFLYTVVPESNYVSTDSYFPWSVSCLSHVFTYVLNIFIIPNLSSSFNCRYVLFNSVYTFCCFFHAKWRTMPVFVNLPSTGIQHLYLHILSKNSVENHALNSIQNIRFTFVLFSEISSARHHRLVGRKNRCQWYRKMNQC